MPVNLAMSVMCAAEFLLWALLGYLFWAKKLQRRFPAMSTYLVLRVASAPVLLLLLFGQSRHWFNDYCYAAYFFTYWAVYIASAITLFFVAIEVFRSALSAFSGLMRFGTLIFRWALVVSIILSMTSISYTKQGILIVPEIAARLMRGVSIVELCLLAFLCISMNALKLSPRDQSFGIALGFGMLSANDFVMGSLLAKFTALTSPLQFVGEALTLVSLGVWVTYFGLPEPVRKPVVIPANSTIYRWNEIASALGHTGTQVAVVQPASSFFLTDVEKVVDKVLTRNLRESETKS
jgi:hypothetical protein